MKFTIAISSYERLPLLRRVLWGIADRPPPGDYEVVLVDDGSRSPILEELRKYSSRFAWTFVHFDHQQFARATGVCKFFNNSSATQNIAFRLARGDYLYQQGNEVIPWGDVYSRLWQDAPPKVQHWAVMSTTLDVPPLILARLDEQGSNLTQEMVDFCRRWPLQSQEYRSDVTNYISLWPRQTLWTLQGLDERYMGGISAEDSDLVRRARCLPGFTQVISEGLSLHQSHGGKTAYYDPHPSVITRERFAQGCAINRAIYDAWDGRPDNPQPWEWGRHGVVNIQRNWT